VSFQQQIRFCVSPDRVRIAYAVCGQGPPLVKTANWLSHLQFDAESPVWRHWLEELCGRYTLVRYDTRGSGLSDWDAQDLSLAACVRDLESVVDSLDLRRFPLLGLSRGAAIAVAYAVAHPDRVSGLILCGGFARARLKRDRLQAQEAEMLLDLIRLGWGQENSAFRQVYTTLFIPSGTSEQMRWWNDLQRISTSPEVAARLQAASFTTDVTDLATKVRAPTLVFHAQHDAVVPFSEGRLLAALIPGARFVPLASENHVLLDDEPAWHFFLAETETFLHGAAATGGSMEGLAALPAFGELTAREREVVELIAEGMNNGEIAERLVLSPKTVRNHITHIFEKLQVETRAQAIVRARDAGFGGGRAAF
jgi:pimeloyl-ACP methyl ester carboxylesterase/DNA-binding CsgD family transcriptional regulator